jgi:CheY-like chemotaxis protein
MEQCCFGLIIDDTPGVLRFVETVLANLGYQVRATQSGQEALEILQADPQRICFALVDVRMPGLDGPATVVELLRLRPDLPCAFMTGSMGEYTPEDLYQCGGRSVLEKPFTVEQLLAVVRPLADAAHRA